jgi:hypothetical protein
VKIDDLMTEKVWQAEVIALARHYQWLIYHPLPSMNRRGTWATHANGDIGFPDLVLAHHRYGTVFAELKTNRGRLTATQQVWLDTLHSSGCETAVWRPRDRQTMRLRLMGDRHAG